LGGRCWSNRRQPEWFVSAVTHTHLMCVSCWPQYANSSASVIFATEPGARFVGARGRCGVAGRSCSDLPEPPAEHSPRSRAVGLASQSGSTWGGGNTYRQMRDVFANACWCQDTYTTSGTRIVTKLKGATEGRTPPLQPNSRMHGSSLIRTTVGGISKGCKRKFPERSIG